MEKRYQVFISSTFQDLQGARQEVSQALLRADCFPAGMELFPAADEEQFEFIKTVIDQSDYYILISAGRYGSFHLETGLSYTEMEYDYAVDTGKPVIRLLHKDPKSIADEGDEKLAKLLVFRGKLKEARMNAFWCNPDQLGKEVAYALMELKKTKPAIGWVRGDKRASTEAELEIYQLKEKLSNLQIPDTNLSIEERLHFELPFTESVIERAGYEPLPVIFDLVEAVEKAIDTFDARRFVELHEWLLERSDIAAIREMEEKLGDGIRLLVDALILDRFLSSGVSSRLSVTPVGRATISKARLMGFVELGS